MRRWTERTQSLAALALAMASGCYPTVLPRDARPGTDAAEDAALMDAPDVDTPTDVGAERVVEAAVEAAVDAPQDAPQDVLRDAPQDAPADVSNDVPTDAPVDAPRDAATDGGASDGGNYYDDCVGRQVGTLYEPNARPQQITIGHDLGCAIMGPERNVRCWGATGPTRGNGPGVVGVLGAPLRYDVMAPLTGFHEIAAGHDHACARTGGGETYCWGSDSQQQLTGWPGSEPLIGSVRQMPGFTYAISAGYQHTCAIVQGESSTVQCWGSNGNGALGSAVPTARWNRVGPFEPGVTVCGIAAGAQFNCVLLANGHVHCWGDNRDSQLGEASPGDVVAFRPAARQVPLDGIDGIMAVRAGGAFACVIGRRGTVSQGAFCWGRNWSGQLGPQATALGGESALPWQIYGSAVPRATPIGDVVLANATGCLITDTHVVACWGDDMLAQLGQGGARPGTFSAEPLPIRTGASPLQFEDLMIPSSSSEAFCAFVLDEGSSVAGDPICWGNNSYGLLARRGFMSPPDGGATPPAPPDIATLLLP